jgi:hypothetical protein
MKAEEVRITNAISLIEIRIEALLQANLVLADTVDQLKRENSALKEKAESAIARIDCYITELEDIRKHYGSSNNSN